MSNSLANNVVSYKPMGLWLPLLLPLLLFSSTNISANDSKAELNSTAKETVVVIHGLGRSNMAMWRLAAKLENAGYEVHRVGYRSFNTTSDEVIASVSQQINDCCKDQNKPVNFVGHSLGGLLIRAYLQNNNVKQLGRVVMIGTPNNGSGIADRFKDHCLIDLVPIAAALGTDETSLPNRLAPPYYPVGIIAGTLKNEFNDKDLPGRDDGLVSVESTKLKGMTDFIEVESGHSMLRYNNQVAEQTIQFLKTGRFNKP